MNETVNTRVIFGAVKKSGKRRNINGVLTYDEEIINIGSGMDIRSGEFKVPEEGFYSFSFSGTAFDDDAELGISVNVVKNGAEMFDFDDFNSKKGSYESGPDYQWRSLSGQWMAKLNKGDTIHLHVDTGYLSTDNGQRIYFTGQLLLKSD